MAYLQILWSQNERRLFPNPLAQFPSEAQAAKIARGRQIFSTKVAQGVLAALIVITTATFCSFLGPSSIAPPLRSTVK